MKVNKKIPTVKGGDVSITSGLFFSLDRFGHFGFRSSFLAGSALGLGGGFLSLGFFLNLSLYLGFRLGFFAGERAWV
ncbi:MAG: hypothetical protein V8Q79_03240 [Christensenellales bacterium]